MAITQFNQFEPKIAGLEGNMQAEPRVFAHDAAAVVIGAVNGSWSDSGAAITTAGAGYNGGVAVVSSGTATTTTLGVGVGLTVDCTVEVISGAITSVEVNAAGSGYAVGDTVTVDNIGGAGGGSCTLTISNIDIPNTQRRGCCLYSGASQTVQVELESGNTVSFVGVNAGSFLPILAKRLVVGTNILALY